MQVNVVTQSGFIFHIDGGLTEAICSYQGSWESWEDGAGNRWGRQRQVTGECLSNDIIQETRN